MAKPIRRKARRTRRVVVLLTDAEYRKVARRADVDGVSVSALVRRELSTSQVLGLRGR